MDKASPRLRLGTRGSALALAQSGTVADSLRALGADVDVVVIRTAGDTRSPDTVWGEGAFVTALEAALLDRRIDVAVHSAKDVPTTEDPRLRIAAYPTREDPRDALVARLPGTSLATLPRGARIGTDSPRRAAFLRAYRPDLRPHPLHGNVDTRLRRLESGETDALILAVAGLARLGLAGRVSEAIPTDVLPPAPGQGALAVQCRADDETALTLVKQLDDPATRAAVEAERAFLAASGGGCRAPLGGLGLVSCGVLTLVAAAADPGAIAAGDAPEAMAAEAPGTTFTLAADGARPAPVVAWGRREVAVADRYEAAGLLAAEIAAGLPGGWRPRVVVTREVGRASGLLGALQARGIPATHVPAIAVAPVAPEAALVDALRAPAMVGGQGANAGTWIVVTSAHGVAALTGAAAAAARPLEGLQVAVVGPATRAALERAGGRAAFIATTATGEHLGATLPVETGMPVVVLRGDRAAGSAATRLRERGASVTEHTVYRTTEAPRTAEGSARAAIAAGTAGFVFTSGSTVRGLLALLPEAARVAATSLPAWCVGPSTAAAARAAGFRSVYESAAGDLGALVDLVAATLSASPDTQTSPAAHPTEEPPA